MTIVYYGSDVDGCPTLFTEVYLHACMVQYEFLIYLQNQGPEHHRSVYTAENLPRLQPLIQNAQT